jgi:hypothetical protein
MSKVYNQRPSNIAGIDDEYTAYCLDEACAFMISKIEDGETPCFVTKYTSFSELYKQYK